MDWSMLLEWVDRIADAYHINPVIFAVVYFGAMPFFMASLWWLIRCLKRRQKLIWPALSTGFWFCSSYLYLVIAGRNVPWWAYALAGGVMLYGTYFTWRSLRRHMPDGSSDANSFVSKG